MGNKSTDRDSLGRWLRRGGEPPGEKAQPHGGRTSSATRRAKNALVEFVSESFPLVQEIVWDDLRRGDIRSWFRLAQIALPRQARVEIEGQIDIRAAVISATSPERLEAAKAELSKLRASIAQEGRVIAAKSVQALASPPVEDDP